ncbi:MAG: hypothetical protein HOV79_27295 [Hamadaea sp.]|nr:hypothetical protein [Hamadaea sp.]
MRHIWSLIAGVVIAPLTWAVVAFGQAVTGEVFKDGPISGYESKLAIAAAALVGAGLIFGLIGTLRVSPVGPLVAALAYLGSYAVLVFAPRTAYDLFDRSTNNVAGYDIPYFQPLVSGVIPLLGGVLLMAVFSAGRWRAWPSAAAAGAETTTVDATPWTATPVSPAGSAPTDTTADTTSTSTWPSSYATTTPSTTTGNGDDTNGTTTTSTSPWGPPPSR